MSNSTYTTKFEFITKKTPRSDGFTVELYHTHEKEIIPIQYEIFPKSEEGGVFSKLTFLRTVFL